MKKPILKTNPLLGIINNSLVDLPTPSNINYMWNFGSLLGLCLVIQILTGLFLAIHYSCDINLSFFALSHIVRDTNLGWLTRIVHLNTASLFFICLYLHISRGIYYQSYRLVHTWSIGIVIFLLVMITAFLGYVLPWGQMSYWGATVITNLASAVPYIGTDVVQWIWGGFTVANPTLTRFFSFHFICPFIIAALVMIHLLYLHQTGSNNPLGSNSNVEKLPFHPYFTIKDFFGFLFVLTLFFIFILLEPYTLGDPENFIPANPLVTPVHIQPEWYFLFAYAILRSIPNKLGGVVAMILSIVVWFTLPLSTSACLFRRNKFIKYNQLLVWVFFNRFLVLTWIGARPVEDPYIMIGLITTIIYFSFIRILYLPQKFLNSFN